MAFGPHLLLAVFEGLVSSAVLALTALGLSLVFGVMRIVNVAHGEFFMLGAVFAWWFSSMVAGDPALGTAALQISSADTAVSDGAGGGAPASLVCPAPTSCFTIR